MRRVRSSTDSIEMTGTRAPLKNMLAVLVASAIGAAFVFCVSGLAATRALAQSDAKPSAKSHGVLSVEANPFRGSLAFTRIVSPKWELGVGFGFGFPQIDQTLLRGKRDDFRDYANLSAIARRNYGKRALLEMSARVGVADYQACTASDCPPKLYFGPSVLFAVGGEHVKIGPRFSFGEISSQSGDLDVFASISPLNLLLSWRF